MNRTDIIKKRNARRKELNEDRKNNFNMTNEVEYQGLVSDTAADIEYLISKLGNAEKALERLSTGKFSAPMEYSQIEAYQKYAESALERIRE